MTDKTPTPTLEVAMSELGYPKPVPPKPPIARQHCRHYSYKFGLSKDAGPQCAAGVDIGHGSTAPCMPQADSQPRSCLKREDWTDEEHAAWKTWQGEHTVRMVLVLSAIPKDAKTVLSAILYCANCWHQSARIIGNIRAGDIDRAIREILPLLSHKSAKDQAMNNVGRWVTVRYQDLGGDLIINADDFDRFGLKHDVKYRLIPYSDTHARLWLPLVAADFKNPEEWANSYD